MRNLRDVIEQMKKVSQSLELNKQFDSILSSLEYSAPELQTLHWHRTAEALSDEIPELTEDWHVKMAEIFSGKDSELRVE